MQQALQPLLAADKLAHRLRTSVRGKNSTEEIRCYDMEIGKEKSKSKKKKKSKRKGRKFETRNSGNANSFFVSPSPLLLFVRFV